MSWTRIFLFLFSAVILVLALAAGSRYEGHWSTYLIFTLLANALLANGFRKSAIYFDTFIGIFLWLGFWAKFSIRITFASGLFHEGIGNFNRSAEAFDQVLLISSCGFFALLVASIIRRRFFVYPVGPSTCEQTSLFRFYQSFRIWCITAFLAVALLVAASNISLGIYQRGMVTQTILPFGLNGVYKWLLQFGFASISALIIRFEIELNRNVSLMAIFPPLLENFFSSISLLSRGMVLNSAALTYGGLKIVRAMRVRIGRTRVFLALTSGIILFVISLYTVTYIRTINFSGGLDSAEVVEISISSILSIPGSVFLDRWVGVEGVMAVSSSKMLGWDIWREAWYEKFQEGQLSLYDSRFIDSPYAGHDVDKPINHFVSLPGVIAFMYYPGSFMFLFFGMILIGLTASLLEILAFRFTSGNWILCSLFGQVVAYRLSGFGYVPSQSYLLFGALALNILLIYLADRVLRWFYFIKS